jgi:hypothetical protein
MKNAVLWDVAPCSSCMHRRFGGTYRLHLQGRKIRERGTSMSRWLHHTLFQNLSSIQTSSRINATAAFKINLIETSSVDNGTFSNVRSTTQTSSRVNATTSCNGGNYQFNLFYPEVRNISNHIKATYSWLLVQVKTVINILLKCCKNNPYINL